MMNRLLVSLLAAGIAAMPMDAKEKLNVLYVGGSANMETMGVSGIDSVALAASVKERTANFTKFLKKHFTR